MVGEDLINEAICLTARSRRVLQKASLIDENISDEKSKTQQRIFTSKMQNHQLITTSKMQN